MHIVMNDENGCHLNDGHLIGICLLGDGLSEASYFSASTSKALNHEETVIGSIRCVDLNSSIDKLRLQLVTELPTVPPKFKFLCKKGWPIERSLEHNLSIKYLISSEIVRIQREFDVPRLGVRWFEGEFLGFIFVHYNSNLTKTREAICNQLGEKVGSLGCSYEFRDNHGWPVMLNQEKDLILWDVCDRNCVSVCKVDRKVSVSSSKHHGSAHEKSSLKNKWTEGDAEDRNAGSVRKKPKYLEDDQTVVISYVHGEASKQARDLKSELVNLGRKVFLDTDDIPGGRDWQDTLNKALNDCIAFIALVTPSYGETRWTNREAKFADEKQKHIIPISFLNTWPPDQLAIQFFALQYIPWKTAEEIKQTEAMGNGKRAQDIRFWEQPCVHRVAKEIIKWLPDSDSIPEPPLSTHFSYSAISSSVDGNLRRRPALVSMQSDGFEVPVHYSEECVEVVISAHPKQRDFADKIKKQLEEANIRVWCSFDMLDSLPGNMEDGASQNSDSQQSPVAPEPTNSPRSPVRNANSENSSESIVVAKRPQFLFSYSTDGINTYSQEFNSQELFTPDTPIGFSQMKQLFKHKTKKAKLVILIVSKDYCESCTCKQQAFYCERRKKVIAIKYGDFSLRCTLSNLYQEQNMLKGSDDCIFLKDLKIRVKQELDLNSCNPLNFEERRIQKLVSPIKKKIRSETCIYIIGGTSFISSRTENICFALGTELAKMKTLSLATEGFFGVCEVVGRNFCEEREIKKEKPSGVYHIIPCRDDKDFSKIARQNEEGYFERIPYGETIYCGSSVSERDTVASTLFKICILIEGGSRTSRLAEKFAWNDCIIIPIVSTEGVTSDKYDFPSRMLKVPCGVSDCDWYKLQDSKAAAEDIAITVKKIIKSLFKMREMKLRS